MLKNKSDHFCFPWGWNLCFKVNYPVTSLKAYAANMWAISCSNYPQFITITVSRCQVMRSLFVLALWLQPLITGGICNFTSNIFPLATHAKNVQIQNSTTSHTRVIISILISSADTYINDAWRKTERRCRPCECYESEFYHCKLMWAMFVLKRKGKEDICNHNADWEIPIMLHANHADVTE